MKTNVRYIELLAIFVPILVLMFGWGMNINSRIEVTEAETTNNRNKIDRNADKIEKVDDKIDENFKLILDKLDKLEEKLSR